MKLEMKLINVSEIWFIWDNLLPFGVMLWHVFCGFGGEREEKYCKNIIASGWNLLSGRQKSCDILEALGIWQ